MPEAAQAEVARTREGRSTPVWSPEMAALLACARAHSTLGATPLRLDPALDGEHLLQEAADHGMTSMLRQCIAETVDSPGPPAPTMPEDFRQTLEERYRANIRQGLKHTAVLVEVMEGLGSAGLTALPYKGPTLSAQLFGDPALRAAGDLDILLPQDEVMEACGRLSAMGFAPLRHYAPGIEKQLLRYRGEIGLVRDGVLVELQWRLAPQYFSVPLDVRALVARATRVEIAGAKLQALSAEDNLLVLCIHGAKHHWQTLRWLLDIRLVIRKNPDLCWTTVEQRARATGTQRLLGLGLRLAETLLDAPIPASLRTGNFNDESVRAAEQQILTGLAAFRMPTEAEHHRLMLRLRERFSDRARYLFRLSWQPTESEWESVALPPALHFAYHGVRVGRVLAKALRLSSA